ncbi:MAG: hypothetical protein ACFFBD_25570, partial [Candidatus Hodarchaeota archaeon]
ETEAWQRKLADVEKQILHLQNLTDTMKSLEKERNALEVKIQNTTKEIDTNKKDLNYLELENNSKKLEQLKDDQKRLLDALPRLEGMIKEQNEINANEEKQQATLSQLTEAKTTFNEKQYTRLNQEVEKLKVKQTEKETLIKAITKTQIPDKQRHLRDIKGKERKLQQIRKDLEIAQRKLQAVALVRKFTNEIVPALRRQHILAISEYATEIFSYLMNNEEYEGIEVTEDYELKILQSGRKHDLTILSGGEQVIACLAIRLAIAKILADQDILLLDEPTNMLDSYRRKELVQVFERTRPVRQSIIVTHDTEFERVADTTFTIVKSAGQARVIAEDITQIVAQQKEYQSLTQKRFQQLELETR